MKKSELDELIDRMMTEWYAEHPDDDRDVGEIAQSAEFAAWVDQGVKEVQLGHS